MMIVFQTITHPLFLLHRLLLGRYNIRQIAPKLSSLGKMNTSGTDNSSIHEGPIIALDNGSYFMVGTVRVPFFNHQLLRNMQNCSLSSLTRCNSSTECCSESCSMSDPTPSSLTNSKQTQIHRRTRVDLGSKNLGAVTCGEYNPSSSSEKKGSSPKFDICWLGKGENTLLGASLRAPNEESCTEMREVTKQRILRPGMVLIKDYISHNDQAQIVKSCRELGVGPGGFYLPGYKDGAKLRLQMMCLGLDWDPQTRKYGKKRSIDGSEPPRIPDMFSMLVKGAIHEAHSLIKKETGLSNVEDILPSINPDICIINFYSTNGRLGLHQDRDESAESLRKGLPVVSFSVGDSAEFLYGDERDVDKTEKVVLESGDVLIFGGESRHVFHGVSTIIPDSAPVMLLKHTGLRPGRLNLTFRQF